MAVNNHYDMINSTDREEEIRIKKMRQGVISNTENEEYIKEREKRSNTPLSFKEKVSNFWYHYKWAVLGCTFFAAAITFLTIQGITKEKYDTTVLLCTYNYYQQSSLDKLEINLLDYVDDIDKNGKKSISVYQALYKENPEDDEYIGLEGPMQARIMAEIASGENCLFILEKNIANDISESGAFVDLREVLGIESDKPVYSFSLENSKILSNEDFENAKKNYCMSIRVYKKGTNKEVYNAQLNTLKKIYNEVK